MLSYLLSVLEYNIQADFPHTAQSLTLLQTTDKHTQTTTENSKRIKDVST